jgi:hypothetical protein
MERHQTKGIVDGDEIDLCWRVHAWSLAAVENLSAWSAQRWTRGDAGRDRDLEDINRQTGFGLDTIWGRRAKAATK